MAEIPLLPGPSLTSSAEAFFVAFIASRETLERVTAISETLCAQDDG